MDDERVWAFEKSLWTGDADHYKHLIDTVCVMAIPTPPFVAQGVEAVEAVARTPRWEDVTFSEGHIVRPQEGLIVIAYRAAAKGGGQSYEARCTSTYRRLEHDEWRVVQHQQTPPHSPVASD
jgi:hypothetical protein